MRSIVITLNKLSSLQIFADKCYDAVGIVLFGTAGTNNQLATDNQYQHVTGEIESRE